MPSAQQSERCPKSAGLLSRAKAISSSRRIVRRSNCASLAHIAGIPQLKAAFAEGQDIHAMTASEMFGVQVAGMPPEVRRRAKAINFGIIYGISAFGLANQLGIPREEASAYIKKYFERFSPEASILCPASGVGARQGI
jgi:hypothetical protein